MLWQSSKTASGAVAEPSGAVALLYVEAKAGARRVAQSTSHLPGQLKFIEQYSNAVASKKSESLVNLLGVHS